MPVLLLTAHGSIDLAVQAVKDGAENFLTKPVELPALLVVVERLMESRRLRQVSEAGRSRDGRAGAPSRSSARAPSCGGSREQAARVAAALDAPS